MTDRRFDRQDRRAFRPPGATEATCLMLARYETKWTSDARGFTIKGHHEGGVTSTLILFR